MSCKTIDSLFSRSRSLQELIWSKYDNFCCIFWTADPSATKLVLIVHYHNPECFMEKLDCCVQGQGHSKIQNVSDCLSRWRSESLNLLLLNLVWWCIIMSQIVFQKDWCAVFKVNVTVKNNINEIWLYNILPELQMLLQFSLVWWYTIIRWIFLWKDLIALLWSRSRSQKRLRIPLNVHLNDISSAAEPSVTKIDIMGQSDLQ